MNTRTGKNSDEGFGAFIILCLIVATVWYSLVGVFEEDGEPPSGFEVFILETGLAATSGLVAPINAYLRNTEDEVLDSYGYRQDMASYAEVYNEGLDKHVYLLIAGDLFGSVFSILSAIAYFFAVRSRSSMGAFKTMFITEAIEETLYYTTVYRMTGVFDVTVIDIGVSLVIAVIVAGFAESKRLSRN